MKNKIIIFITALCACLLSSCSFEAPLVAPPSWKGFNYVVKQPVPGNPGDTVQVKRGALYPGAPVRVYAVRKSQGRLIGQITGTIKLRCTLYPSTGAPQTTVLDESVISLANDTYDGWEDPYATFTLPSFEGDYDYFKVEVACRFLFNTFGNQDSEVDFSDETSNEAPYLGNIYTDRATFHPMNGGSATSGNEGSDLKYHTIYTYTK